MIRLARYEVGPLEADAPCVWAEAGDGHFKASHPCSTPHATRATMSYQLHRRGGRSLATVRAMCEVHARDWAQRNGAVMPADMSPLAVALAEVARLREALEKIANGTWPIGGYDDMTGADHMREIARAALATAKAKGG